MFTETVQCRILSGAQGDIMDAAFGSKASCTAQARNSARMEEGLGSSCGLKGLTSIPFMFTLVRPASC